LNQLLVLVDLEDDGRPLLQDQLALLGMVPEPLGGADFFDLFQAFFFSRQVKDTLLTVRVWNAYP
jgi:hypothetical protein